MAPSAITVKLRCGSWKQLEAIYRRDLSRSALFLKSSNRPPLGTSIEVHLSLPSGTVIILTGAVNEHVPAGGLGGRGPGVDLELTALPQSTMWLIESALASHRRSGGPGAAAPASEPDVPSMEAGESVADAEDELVSALEGELASFRRLNPFQVLGVDYGVDDDGVRAAFAELTRRYHPDRFARYQSSAAREHAAEIFILIRDAYRALRTAQARELTRRGGAPGRGPQPRTHSPAGGSAPARGAPAGDAPTASTPAQPRPGGGARSRRAPDHGAGSATPAGERAAPVDPGGALGDAGALLDRGQFDEALAMYELAVRRDPNNRDARVGVEVAEGYRALDQHDRLEAAQRLEAALELDPENERALRGIAEIRRRTTDERKGFLSRLLGKKEE